MSGVRTSTLLAGLHGRGHLTVDTDDDGWTLPDGRRDEPRVAALLDRQPIVVVSGAVENQGRFSVPIEHVVLVSAPLATLLDRVGTRTDTPSGRRPEKKAEIVRPVETAGPLLS